MVLSGILFPTAILWVIMYFVFGVNSVPSFWPLVITLLLVSIATALISSVLGIIAIISNFIIFTAVLALIFRLDFKQTLLSVGIFQVVMLVIQVIQNSLY